MYDTWHTLAERWCFHSQGHIRLGFSDTDSYFVSNQRMENELEQIEKQELLETDIQVPYESTMTAYLNATAFIKATSGILDWSSLAHEESYVYNTLIRPSETVTAQVVVVVVFYVSTHHYKRICPSVGPSVRRYIHRSIQLPVF